MPGTPNSFIIYNLIWPLYGRKKADNQNEKMALLNINYTSVSHEKSK